MDELTIDVESLAVDGGAALEEGRFAEAIRTQIGEALDGEVLTQVSWAVVASIEAARPGPAGEGIGASQPAMAGPAGASAL